MPLKAALTAIAAAVLFAVLPVLALATDLRSELPAPAGSGWQERPTGTDGDGPMSLEDVAGGNRDPAYARGVLQRSSYQSGYRRVWFDSATQETVTERVYVFGSALGAGFWLGTVKGGDEDASDWQQTYDTSSIINSFGGYRITNGMYDTVVEFAPSDRVYAVSVLSPTGQQKSLAMTQAQTMSANAPGEVFSGSGASDAARALAIVGGFIALVAVIAGVIILFAIRSSRRRAPVPAPSFPTSVIYSPDGQWWWDGRQWQPTGPRRPASP